MKPIFSILFSLFFLASCGNVLKKDVVNKDSKRQYASTNAAFKPYVDKFEAYGKKELASDNFTVSDVPINFGDTENEAFDGVCFTYTNGDKEIIIKKEWWDKNSETQREILILHELGHCSLGRTHDEEKAQVDGKAIPVTIMNSTIPLSSQYKDYKEGYLSELYTHGKEKMISALSAGSSSTSGTSTVEVAHR